MDHHCAKLQNKIPSTEQLFSVFFIMEFHLENNNWQSEVKVNFSKRFDWNVLALMNFPKSLNISTPLKQLTMKISKKVIKHTRNRQERLFNTAFFPLEKERKKRNSTFTFLFLVSLGNSLSCLAVYFFKVTSTKEKNLKGYQGNLSCLTNYLALNNNGIIPKKAYIRN